MRKKLRYILPIALLLLGVTGAAIAYFTSSGSGNGQATVGTSSSWTVTQTSANGTMYPGTGSTTIQYKVTNAGTGYQELNGTTGVLATDGSGNVMSGGSAVIGCLASWFSVSNTSPAAVDLASGASASSSLQVTMSDSGTNQNVCQGVTPTITISAS